jgi:hypothetical protein
MPWIMYNELGWRWGRIDAEAVILAESSRGFATRGECLADAKKHGCSGDSVLTQQIPSDGDV